MSACPLISHQARDIMSYKWPIRFPPFVKLFSEGASLAIFSTFAVPIAQQFDSSRFKDMLILINQRKLSRHPYSDASRLENLGQSAWLAIGRLENLGQSVWLAIGRLENSGSLHDWRLGGWVGSALITFSVCSTGANGISNEAVCLVLPAIVFQKLP